MWANQSPNSFRSTLDSPVPFVWVRDGVESYCRALYHDETLEEACEEFADGYDTGGSGPVTCIGTLLDITGDVVDDYRFEVR